MLFYFCCSIEEMELFYETLFPWIGRSAKEIGFYFTDKMNRKGIDLTIEQWVLLKLLHQKDGQPQQDLAFLTNKNKASLTRLIQNLEKKTLISRIPSEKDKRVNHVYLTSKGKEVFATTLSMVDEMVDELQAGIGEEEIKQTISTLEKFLTNVISKRKEG